MSRFDKCIKTPKYKNKEPWSIYEYQKRLQINFFRLKNSFQDIYKRVFTKEFCPEQFFFISISILVTYFTIFERSFGSRPKSDSLQVIIFLQPYSGDWKAVSRLGIFSIKPRTLFENKNIMHSKFRILRTNGLKGNHRRS